MSAPFYATGWRTAPPATDPYGDDGYYDLLGYDGDYYFLGCVNGADTPPEGRRSSRSTTGTSQQSAAATDPPCAPEPPTSALPGGARSSAILAPPHDACLKGTACEGQHPAANTAANHGPPQADPGDRRCTLPPAAVAGPLALILAGSALTALIGAL